MKEKEKLELENRFAEIRNLNRRSATERERERKSPFEESGK